MSELKNDRFLRALMRQPVDMTPVWMMRQAGRYLPEYRESRGKAGDFMSLCTNPDLACEVTLQPLERYPLDAAILFSDILTIPDAMGLGLYFETGEGPRFRKPVRTEADINNLSVIDPHKDLPYVVNAVSTIRRELNGRVPLIGFSGSPWTLATYMVEGSSSKDFARCKTMAYNQPELMHQLLDTLAKSVIVYLNAQIEAGAQAVQIFDTWGGALSHAAYREFSLQYMSKIVAGLIKEHEGRPVPVILFTKGGGQWLEDIARREYGDEILSHVPASVDTEQFNAPPRTKSSAHVSSRVVAGVHGTMSSRSSGEKACSAMANAALSYCSTPRPLMVVSVAPMATSPSLRTSGSRAEGTTTS